ncbi:hypothetical protein SAMN05216482_1107 [Streptomyces sp. PAN_FS17]|nr:hypothetical protein SAMN05216482_1107 [Streptomyces sp. PAN_FS17]
MRNSTASGAAAVTTTLRGTRLLPTRRSAHAPSWKTEAPLDVARGTAASCAEATSKRGPHGADLRDIGHGGLGRTRRKPRPNSGYGPGRRDARQALQPPPTTQACPRASLGLPACRGLSGSGAEAGEPAAGLLRGGLFLCLLAPALLLLALVFVGFGLRLCRNGLTLAVLAQVRVRLALPPVPGVADRLPPVVGELLPAVRVDRSPRLPLSGLPFPTAPFLFPSGLATAGEVGVPAGVTDRVKQRLAAVAAEAPALSFGWLFYWGAVCDDHSDRRPRLGGDGPFLVDRENERLIRTATSIP